ncbi:helix-turn-helix domain-containing protein [Paracoccus sp. (in: a-proteobacteria)]|uniref:helix-turn-helix domain-containing protein n=1 Tax=Paracoccus sp. TaxID=267 RepID=UPI0026DFFFC4|nr:helix-turn-helix domain-containing protein [Paracoccus sp. (in: a-proteobacteria)]MDO5647253.1 helix-turn-helix domain-containing protein [Paracoccus sp. (in: a-proteobacteria)]
MSDDDLWFLPGPLDEPQTPLMDARDWRAAQSALAADLARAAMAVGRLDELIAQMGAGAARRLALQQVESFLWAAGTPLRREEIGRDLMDARADADMAVMGLARWSLRRLEGAGDPADLRGFLALHRAQDPVGVSPRPVGVVFDETAAAFAAMLNDARALHPLALGAFAAQAWRLSGLSPDDDVAEGATLTARLMARDCVALPFVPVARAGLRLGGGAADRLRDHLHAVQAAATAARHDLMRLRDWAARPVRGNAARIIAALLAHPIATTQMVEQAAGVSRDTAERHLARLAADGHVRELTGNSRFRLWAAAV